jgi:hypothetical protein
VVRGSPFVVHRLALSSAPRRRRCRARRAASRFRYTMKRTDRLMHRSASCWALATLSGAKYPRSTPSFSESFVSIVDETENSMKCAKSPGWNRPNPSAMFLVLDEAELRICEQNSASCAARPVAMSAYTSRFSSSASCQTSSSSYRRAPAMAAAPSSCVPRSLTLHGIFNVERAANRTTNPNDERRTSNDEPNPEPRTPNHEPNPEPSTKNQEPR